MCITCHMTLDSRRLFYYVSGLTKWHRRSFHYSYMRLSIHNFCIMKLYFLLRKRSMDWELEAPDCVWILLFCITLHTVCPIRQSVCSRQRQTGANWTLTHSLYPHGPHKLLTRFALVLHASRGHSTFGFWFFRRFSRRFSQTSRRFFFL